MNNLQKKKYIFYLLLSFLITIFCYNSTLADTIALEDGTILVGKVIKRDSRKIVFSNSYGVFKIKKRQVHKLYTTKDYREDIKIHKKLGKKVNEEAIKKDYFAGLKEWERIKEEMARDVKRIKEGWSGGRISLASAYLVTTGKLKNVLPGGFGALIAYDQGLDFISGGKRHFWLPGIRLEGGYLYYEKKPAKVRGVTCSAGPIWLLPFINNQWGRVVFSALPGITFLRIENESKETSDTFTLHSILGYEYEIGKFSIFLHGRYLFVYDDDVNLSGIGGAIGMSFALW